jgi:hypothetical protein
LKRFDVTDPFGPGWSGSADIILAFLPWTILFNMRPTLNIKERLGVAVAMSMGVV